jgi:predicted nuclease with TOPRIM domain
MNQLDQLKKRRDALEEKQSKLKGEIDALRMQVAKLDHQIYMHEDGRLLEAAKRAMVESSAFASLVGEYMEQSEIRGASKARRQPPQAPAATRTPAPKR